MVISLTIIVSRKSVIVTNLKAHIFTFKACLIHVFINMAFQYRIISPLYIQPQFNLAWFHKLNHSVEALV